MRDQLKRLEDLQRHDAKILELENSLKAIPTKLAATQNDLARVEGLETATVDGTTTPEATETEESDSTETAVVDPTTTVEAEGTPTTEGIFIERATMTA